MIREEKLPDHILDRIPGLVERLKKEKNLEAFYIYGNGARSEFGRIFREELDHRYG